MFTATCFYHARLWLIQQCVSILSARPTYLRNRSNSSTWTCVMNIPWRVCNHCNAFPQNKRIHGVAHWHTCLLNISHRDSARECNKHTYLHTHTEKVRYKYTCKQHPSPFSLQFFFKAETSTLWFRVYTGLILWLRNSNSASIEENKDCRTSWVSQGRGATGAKEVVLPCDADVFSTKLFVDRIDRRKLLEIK